MLTPREEMSDVFVFWSEGCVRVSSINGGGEREGVFVVFVCLFWDFYSALSAAEA